MVGGETISIVGNGSRRHKSPHRPRIPSNLKNDPSITHWQVMIFSWKTWSWSGKKGKCPLGFQPGGKSSRFHY